MIVPGGDLKYDIALDNKYMLGDIAMSISLEDSLDEVSVRATAQIVVPDEGFPGIAPGQSLDIVGYPFDSRSKRISFLPSGVIWTCQSVKTGTKGLTITAYDKLIYLLKSEDEEIFSAGQTATQRLQYLCDKWGVKTDTIVSTKTPLALAVRRSMTIYNMIRLDLYETALKGGGLYRIRMTDDGLGLFELGGNSDVWMLELDVNVTSVTQNRTLDNAATRVKVVARRSTGSDIAGSKQRPLAPVLAVESADADKYGTLQKVVEWDYADDGLSPSEVAKSYLAGMQESFSVDCIDINTVWAGDKIYLNGVALYVVAVSRQLGTPGTMHLELGSLDYIKRRFYDKHAQSS